MVDARRLSVVRTTEEGRPAPLRDAAAEVARWTALLGSVVTALVGYGVLSSALGDAVQGLLGVIPGAVTAVVAVWSAVATARRGEPWVTPVQDPRDDGGRVLRAA